MDVENKKSKDTNKFKRGIRKFISILKINDKVYFLNLIINLIIPLAGSWGVRYLNKNTISIYDTLKKPLFSPPSFVFPIVWTILYILMGIAAYRAYVKNKKRKLNSDGYFFYLIQLIFNFAWSFIFFTFRLYGLSFIWLIVLITLVVITIFKFARVDKTSAVLMLPYLLWLIYASVLNYFIWFYNEM